MWIKCKCSVQAFTTDFNVHWAHHLLRPEFIESTYFLYKVSSCVYNSRLIVTCFVCMYGHACMRVYTQICSVCNHLCSVV